MTSQNKSHVLLENNTDAQIEDTTHFGPTHPTELTMCPTYITWYCVWELQGPTEHSGRTEKKTSHVISKLWMKTPALVRHNKSCGRNRLQRIGLHGVERYVLT